MAHLELASLFAANFRDNRESDSQLIWCVDNICWFGRCERIVNRPPIDTYRAERRVGRYLQSCKRTCTIIFELNNSAGTAAFLRK
jgi:hypothetical protein